MNGVKVTHEEFPKALLRNPPGTDLTVTLFRRGLLVEAKLTTGKAPPEKYAFTPVNDPTPLEKSIYEGWVGSPWEAGKKPAVPAS
ncbi:MAG: hypothetical protein L3J96_02635 [Thermoplasmata archaeon]|nr:hypothetical protein [Thermoplasmata archaeon]